MGITVFCRALFVATTATLIGCGGGGESSEPGASISSLPSSSSSSSSSTSSSSSSSSSGSIDEALTFLVSTAATTGGSISPSSITVSENGTTSFTIAQEDGYALGSVSGCGGTLSGTVYTTGIITASCTVSADFVLKSYKVSATAGAGGGIAPEQITVRHNDSTSFTLAPDAGYAIAAASGCAGTLVGDVYTTGSVTSDCLVSAQFEPLLFSISGAVSGLQGTLQLSYQLTTGNAIAEITADGIFEVTGQAQLGHDYQVSVHAQPLGQECVVANGAGVVANDVTDIAITCETLIPPARITGSISASGAIAVDADINDVFAPYSDNSAPSAAQSLYHLATAHGFASAEPTLGSTDSERFAATADANDFYRVVLDAGQTVQLQVVDYDGVATGGRFDGDLDLYLLDADYNLVGASESTTEFEKITVPTSQEYLIQIYAYAGVSKYVLHLSPAPTNTSSITSAAPAPEFVPKQMIVKFHEQAGVLTSTKPDANPGMTASQAAGRSARLDIDLTNVVPDSAMDELQQRNQHAYERMMTLRSIKKMREREDVIYAEPNYVRRALLTPNDPKYSYQWHYSNIGLPQAWDITTGTGLEQDVVVAVIDTGVVLAHPDFNGQLVTGYDFISSTERSRDGDGIDANPDDPGDSDTQGHSSWHGTHVAGTVAAASNNSVGVAGVAWGAKIMPLRALGKGGGTTYDIIQAARWAAGLPNDSGTVPLQRADIINMSFGSSHGSVAEQEAFAEIRAAGVMLVAAAGNGATSTALYPAAYPEVLSVSATDYANQQAPYSNFGTTIAVAAPGGNASADLNRDGYGDGVLSTFADDSKGSIKPVYSFANGTSMAAPHVAGVLALMKAVNAQLTPNDIDSLLIAGSLTDDLGTTGRDDIYGYGLINALKAVQAAVSMAEGAEPAPVDAKVIADPSQLNLGFLHSGSIDIINQGGGTPKVLSAQVSATWLQVAAETVDVDGLGRYSVSIERAGLEGGVYSGEVIFNIDDGSQVIVPVTMHVDSAASGGELARLYVLLLDSTTGEVVDEIAVDGGAGSISYAFEQVPAGEYRIVAGSDVDVDDLICSIGESCGGFSSMDHLQTIIVNGVDVTGVDFTAGILSGFSTLSETNYTINRTAP